MLASNLKSYFLFRNQNAKRSQRECGFIYPKEMVKCCLMYCMVESSSSLQKMQNVLTEIY